MADRFQRIRAGYYRCNKCGGYTVSRYGHTKRCFIDAWTMLVKNS